MEAAVAALRDQKLLSDTKNGVVYSGSRRPHELVSLGSSAAGSFRVVVAGKTLETMDRGQAFREAHLGAILLHQGEQYLVEDVDLLQGIIRVKEADVDYYTRPLKSVEIKITETKETRQTGDMALSFGSVEVTERYYAYKIIRNDAILGIEALDLPPLIFMTRALWFEPPVGLEKIVGDGDVDGGLHGVEHAFIARRSPYSGRIQRVRPSMRSTRQRVPTAMAAGYPLRALHAEPRSSARPTPPAC